MVEQFIEKQLSLTLSDLMQDKTGRTRAAKRSMAGRIWRAGHQFDTPGLKVNFSRKKTIRVVLDQMFRSCTS